MSRAEEAKGPECWEVTSCAGAKWIWSDGVCLDHSMGPRSLPVVQITQITGLSPVRWSVASEGDKGKETCICAEEQKRERTRIEKAERSWEDGALRSGQCVRAVRKGLAGGDNR